MVSILLNYNIQTNHTFRHYITFTCEYSINSIFILISVVLAYTSLETTFPHDNSNFHHCALLRSLTVLNCADFAAVTWVPGGV